MKPCSPEILTLLTSRQFYVADCWTVNLVGGTVLRYCSGDADLTMNGQIFSAGGLTGPFWDRSDHKAKVHWSTGTSVDTISVDVIPGSSTVLGSPFLQTIKQGIWDGAEVILDRLFMPTYGDTTRGPVRFFVGRIADISASRSLVTLDINSHLELLNLQFPRNLVQVPCVNNLGDGACGVNLASYQTTGTVSASPAPSVGGFTAVLGATITDGFLDQGTITFSSGVLNGYAAGVQRAALTGTTAVIAMQGALPSAPVAGTTFTITYGCNKSFTDSNGCPKFSNTARFRGMPYVPQPTLAV